MDTIKFMKTDFLKIKTQIVLILLTVFMILFLEGKMGTLWGIMYMMFMGLIFCSVPFSVDMVSGEGFMKMLPAKPQHRVYGRFCFAVIFLTACTLVVSLTYMYGFLSGTVKVGDVLPEIVSVLSAGLCINAIQYVFSYFLQIKNQQWLSIVRMIPGFVFFFVGCILIDNLASMHPQTVEAMGKAVTYAMTHQGVAAAVFFTVAIVFNIICAVICGKHEAMKE